MVRTVTVTLTEDELINLRNGVGHNINKAEADARRNEGGYADWIHRSFIPELEALEEKLGWELSIYYQEEGNV